MGKQPAGQSLQKHSRDFVNRKKQEASFDDTLRQAALTAVPALVLGTLLDQHQVPIFQQMNQAMLRAYLQQYGKPPSPNDIQHMRGLIRTIWQELIQEYTREEERGTTLAP